MGGCHISRATLPTEVETWPAQPPKSKHRGLGTTLAPEVTPSPSRPVLNTRIRRGALSIIEQESTRRHQSTEYPVTLFPGRKSHAPIKKDNGMYDQGRAEILGIEGELCL